METEPYKLTDFAVGNGIHSDVLNDACKASSFAAKFLGIGIDYNTDDTVKDVFVHLNATLSGSEKIALDALVAGHDGAVEPDKFETVSEIRIADAVFGAVAIIDGVILRPDKMLKVTNRSHVRIVCDFKSDGAGAKLRLKENGVELHEWDLVDTSNVWVPKLHTTNAVLSAGLNRYEVEVELDGATAAEMRYGAIALFDR